MLVELPMRLDTYILTYIQRQNRSLNCQYTYIHTYIQMTKALIESSYAYIHACIHTYIHTDDKGSHRVIICIHTYIHSYVQMTKALIESSKISDKDSIRSELESVKLALEQERISANSAVEVRAYHTMCRVCVCACACVCIYIYTRVYLNKTKIA